MTRPMTAIRSRSLIWWVVLAVVISGCAATAHGLFGVARACTVVWPIAGLYPVMADGLALVAYASTTRLRRRAERAYAWLIVVTAAGTSGLAQGLVGAGIGEPSRDVRFWVHFAPAVVVAVAAHLLWLVSRPAELVSPAHELDDPQRELPATLAPGGSPHKEPAGTLLDVPVSLEPLRLAPPVSPEPGRVACTAGCGRQVSLATFKRHKSKGCPAAAA